jgi:hypothetical protein
VHEPGQQGTSPATTAPDPTPAATFLAEFGLFLGLLAFAFVALGFFLTQFFEIDRVSTWIGAGVSSGLGCLLAVLALVFGARQGQRKRAAFGLALSVVAGIVVLAVNL